MIYLVEKWPRNWASEVNIQHTKGHKFYLSWGSKLPNNWASETHILHTSKSNTDVKPVKTFEKVTKQQNIDLLGSKMA